MQTFAPKSKKNNKRNASEKESRAAKVNPPVVQSSPQLNQESMLLLQRTVGNQAVQRSLLAGAASDGGLIQRDAEEKKEGAAEGQKEETKEAAVSKPWWYQASSNDPIDGVPVPGFEDRVPPYTDDDCLYLKNQLLLRNQANEQIIRNFEANYQSAFINIWTEYVTKAMTESYKASGSFMKQLAGFIIRSTYLGFLRKLTGVSNFAGMTHHEMEAAEKVNAVFGNTVGGTMEPFQMFYEESEASGEVEEQGENLDKLSELLSGLIQVTMSDALSPLGISNYYTLWLGDAPLEELSRFRLPPLLPDIPMSEIEVSIAQAIAGAAHQDLPGLQGAISGNFIQVFLDAPDPGKETPRGAPLFIGSDVLDQKLAGQPVASMPSVALRIIMLTAGSEEADILSINQKMPDYASLYPEIARISQAFPSSGILTISRDPNGSIFVSGGGLAAWLHLYQRAHPDDDPYRLLFNIALRYQEDEGTMFPSITPAMAARELYDHLAPGMPDGAEKIIQETINPLSVRGMAAEPAQIGGQASAGGGPGGVLAAGSSEAKPEAGKEPGKEGPAASPSWWRVSAPGQPINGEPIPGYSDRQGQFTENDRKNLEDLLLMRSQENQKNAANFVGAYSAAFFRVWTGYITEEMAKAVEEAGWEFWEKVAGIVLRASLMMIFEVYVLGELAEVVSEIAETVIEKTAEFGGELSQAEMEKASTVSGLEKRQLELKELGKALSTNVGIVLGNAITAISEGQYYAEWLGDASLSDLNRFRLPHKFPAVDESLIEVSVTQAVSGYLHKDNYVLPGEENSIFLDMDGSIPGQVKVMNGPYFVGDKALAKRLAGHPLDLMPNIPMRINLEGDLYDFDSTLAVSSPEQFIEVKTISNAWSLKSPLVIERNKEGTITFMGGNMQEWFYIYKIAHPDADPFAMISEFTKGMDEPISPHYSSEMAASGLLNRIAPSMQEGAEKFLKESVLPLQLSGGKIKE